MSVKHPDFAGLGRLERHTLVAGFDGLFKSVELKLPCVISVRNFDVHRVIKQLALTIDCRYKWWQEDLNPGTAAAKTCYYTILFRGQITGPEIRQLIWDFEHEV